MYTALGKWQNKRSLQLATWLSLENEILLYACETLTLYQRHASKSNYGDTLKDQKSRIFTFSVHVQKKRHNYLRNTFLYCIFSSNNAWCWRAVGEVLIHDGEAGVN